MRSRLQHYIGGAWVDSEGGTRHQVINPATEQPCTEIVLGSAADVDKAVDAAQAAFASFSRTSVDERLALLERIVEGYKARAGELAEAVSQEMGAPIGIARSAQVGAGLGHVLGAIKALRDFEFEERIGNSLVVHEPIGVVALITPWNWPLNQIMAKVAPALAAGNAMILKPSEEAPTNAMIVAEILDAAGVPPGVFNLINGDGPGVGTALASHKGIDMVSFTGSTRAGILVAKNAADTVKRVHQELGGKSPSVILESADMAKAVQANLMSVLINSGQSCVSPTRMLVPRGRQDEAIAIAGQVMSATQVGDPAEEGRHLGPLVNKAQWDKVQGLITKAMQDGAKLETGGPGRPDGLETGYYVKPTLFSNVTNEMTIAREEIFGPVVTIIPYDSEDEAIAIANDTDYGLSAQVHGDAEAVRRVAPQLRAGQVSINGAMGEGGLPFGGYKQSGNGREGGKFGLADFMEIKTLIGAAA